MIVSAFHATATAKGADAYREHFTHSVLPDLQRIDGYQSAYLLRLDHDSHVELQVLTLPSGRHGASVPDPLYQQPSDLSALAFAQVSCVH